LPVDAEGLRVALDGVGIEVSLAGAKEAMKALDHNSDGTLDAAELTECLREFQRKRRVRQKRSPRSTDKCTSLNC
jgi:Ca2+-binding EF-hand superfamily protein